MGDGKTDFAVEFSPDQESGIQTIKVRAKAHRISSRITVPDKDDLLKQVRQELDRDPMTYGERAARTTYTPATFQKKPKKK